MTKQTALLPFLISSTPFI